MRLPRLIVVNIFALLLFVPQQINPFFVGASKNDKSVKQERKKTKKGRTTAKCQQKKGKKSKNRTKGGKEASSLSCLTTLFSQEAFDTRNELKKQLFGNLQLARAVSFASKEDQPELRNSYGLPGRSQTRSYLSSKLNFLQVFSSLKSQYLREKHQSFTLYSIFIMY